MIFLTQVFESLYNQAKCKEDNFTVLKLENDMNMVSKRSLSLVLLVISLISQHGRANKAENQVWLHEEHDLNPGQTRAIQGSWQTLVNQPPFGGNAPSVGTPLLLTDGSVLVQNTDYPQTGEIWKLIPDSFGNYINGTWQQLASLPTGYAPLFFASAVLPDGRAIYEGGEYNEFGPTNSDPVWTSLGAIFDPTAGPLGTWTSVNPPPFFINSTTDPHMGPALPIGDAASVILENGTFMLADALSRQAALLNPITLTWVETGTFKFDSNNEEGWTLLPNGNVLTVNTNIDQPTNPHLTGSEIYNPLTGAWSNAGSTIVQLSDYGNAYEMGPQVLRPDGTVFVPGATGNTAIYNSFTGLWQAGPMLPIIGSQLACQDAPGTLLPNGDVLFAACPYGLASEGNGQGLPPTYIFELTGTTYIEQPTVPDFSVLQANYFNLLVLPTGQIMMTNVDNTNVYIFTPGDTSYDPNWAPIITLAPLKVSPTKTYKITGIRFNGMSQCNMYGDDAQSATNYPLIRITNNSTGHVFYCRTHDHSFMGVASNQKVYTYFDVPANIELGKSTIEVVANGIPSDPLCIFVQ